MTEFTCVFPEYKTTLDLIKTPPVTGPEVSAILAGTGISPEDGDQIERWRIPAGTGFDPCLQAAIEGVNIVAESQDPKGVSTVIVLRPAEPEPDTFVFVPSGKTKFDPPV